MRVLLLVICLVDNLSSWFFFIMDTLNLPLEVCPSGRSGLGAKSEPIPDEPREDTTATPGFEVPAPTIKLFRHLKLLYKMWRKFDRNI